MNSPIRIIARAIVVIAVLAVVTFILEPANSLGAKSSQSADTSASALNFPHVFAKPEEFTGNDSQKIQKAVNSLVNGGVVLLGPKKHYDLTTTVYYKSNVEILGDSTVITFGGKSGPALAFDRPQGFVERVEFSGIVFTCNDKVPDDLRVRNGQGRSIAIKGFFTQGAKNFTVVNWSEPLK